MVSLQLPVCLVLRHLEVIVVGGQSESNHHAILRLEFEIWVKVAVLRAWHDRIRTVRDQVDKLYASIGKNNQANDDAEAKTLPGALISPPIGQAEEEGLTELVQLDGTILHSTACLLLLIVHDVNFIMIYILK